MEVCKVDLLVWIKELLCVIDEGVTLELLEIRDGI